MASPYETIVPDEEDDSTDDSNYASGSDTGSTSLTSTILNYRWANGRRYHAELMGNYLYPNDESEQNRLDLYHHIFLLILDGDLTSVPFETPPQRVLDIGTGTGIWAIDFADAYPSAQVTGTDISPIQPCWVPPNCKFEVDDCEQSWTWPENTFDYIHFRTLLGAIKDWDFVFEQAFRAVKPGGWIEVQEVRAKSTSDDGTYNESSPFWQWTENCISASDKIGRSLDVAHKLETHITAAGFEIAHHVKRKLPLSPWAKDKKLKELGRYMLSNMTDIIPATIAIFTQVLCWPPDKTSEMMEAAQKDLRNLRMHVYTDVHFISARKPEGGL